MGLSNLSCEFILAPKSTKYLIILAALDSTALTNNSFKVDIEKL